MMLGNSLDPSVRAINAKVKSGRKWQASKETARAEEAAKFKEVLGATQSNRHGLGYASEKKVWWSKATNHERRQLVIQEIRNEAEGARYQTAVQQGQQGQWTSWEDALQRSLSWNDIWHLAPLRVSFIIRSVYDQLPTADNLTKWKVADSNKCPMCDCTQTLQHVLSACKVSLASGRYTWRHNLVLDKIAQAFDEAKNNMAPTAVANGARSQDKASILQGTNEWRVAADLPARRAYPDMISDFGMRPDIVVSSDMNKTVIMVELTVPYEANMSGSHEFKTAKYEELASHVQRKGFKTHLLAVEVGARGFAGSSIYSLFKKLGLSNRRCAWYIKQVTEAAERASYWIWLKRNDKTWTASINSTVNQQ